MARPFWKTSSARRKARRPCRTGDTIIELVCALAIIAALSAAGAPRFAKAITARRAEAAARRLSADLEWLRSTARLTSTSQSMTFNLAASTYNLTGFTNPDVPGAAYSVNLANTTYKTTIASLNFGGATTLSFNGYGIPSAGGTVVVQSGNSTRTVAVDGTTGVVTWQ
ncbi:MAG TPA: GspH/FimT family pseudopilin [Pirellulales bacterium]|nr:GspH/FimT family pseudopilin [Pirellulales bacterium]